MNVWFYVKLSIELLLMGFFVIALIHEGRDESQGLEGWILPAGTMMERGIRRLSLTVTSSKTIRGKTPWRDTEEIRQLLRDMAGKEEGERQYLHYRSRRWGSILLAFFLLLGLQLSAEVLTMRRQETLGTVLVRPAYGEGDREIRVTMTMEGAEETRKKSFTLTVPEQAISGEIAQAAVETAATQIAAALEGKTVYRSFSLPASLQTEYGNVILSYRSLTTDVLRVSGTQVKLIREDDASEKQTTAKIRITASLEGIQAERDAALLITEEEILSGNDRMDAIVKKLQNGVYTEEDLLVLPEQSDQGETLTWAYAEEDDRFLWALLFVLVPALIIAKQDSDYKQLSTRRMTQIRNEYPELIGELVILMGAGLSLSSAWQRLGRDYVRSENRRTQKIKHKDSKGNKAPAKEKTAREKPKVPTSMLMEEVARTGRELEEGVPIREALLQFSERIPVKEVRRFVSLLTQNLRRGDAYVLTRLKELADEAWETRKKLAREKSEEVDTKLMLPLMMLLIVILIMVLSPALISMKY